MKFYIYHFIAWKGAIVTKIHGTYEHINSKKHKKIPKKFKFSFKKNYNYALTYYKFQKLQKNSIYFDTYFSLKNLKDAVFITF